jgi:hypothetical protein
MSNPKPHQKPEFAGVPGSDIHKGRRCDKIRMSEPKHRKRRRSRRHAMNPMLNSWEGHGVIELNYPHIIGISGYERHHDMAT